MSNDQETEDDQNDDVDNNDRVPQECAKCKHPIRHKVPKATSNDFHRPLPSCMHRPLENPERRDQRGTPRMELLFWSRGDKK